MNGLLLLPSLSRPQSLISFFKAYADTKAKMPGLLLIDKDDYLRRQDEYEHLSLPANWQLVQTTATTMCGKIEEMWPRVKDLDYVAICGDDNVVETEHWDDLCIAALTGTNIIGTNDDFMAPRKIAGMTLISGQIFRALGYVFLPGLKHLFVDDFLEYLAGRARCANILMNVMVRHKHFYKGAHRDTTYEIVNGDKDDFKGGFWPHDRAVYEEWHRSGQAERDAQKVIDLQPKMGVMVATPSHDGTCSMDYALGLADASVRLSAQNIYFEFSRVVGSSLIPHARNSLVDMFMKSRCQRLLFIDSDQGWTAEHIFALLNSPRRIVAGVTPHKRYPINLNFQPLPEDKKYFKNQTNKSSEEFFKFAKERADVKGDIEVDRAGTGFIMIDRSVFDLMSTKVSEYSAFDDEHMSQAKHKEFFAMGGHEGKFRGEDWRFCELAKQLKIPIFINSFVLPNHHGVHTYQIDPNLRALA